MTCSLVGCETEVPDGAGLKVWHTAAGHDGRLCVPCYVRMIAPWEQVVCELCGRAVSWQGAVERCQGQRAPALG